MITFPEAKKLCREKYGCSLRHDNGEYRVAYYPMNRDEAEASAYYTNDLEDAILTAAYMSGERLAREGGATS